MMTLRSEKQNRQTRTDATGKKGWHERGRGRGRWRVEAGGQAGGVLVNLEGKPQTHAHGSTPEDSGPQPVHSVGATG